MTTAWQLTDTIAALASPPGPAPRGIVRISGRQAVALLRDWFVPTPPACGTEPAFSAECVSPSAATAVAGREPSGGDTHAKSDGGPLPGAPVATHSSATETAWHTRPRAWRTPGTLRLPPLHDPLEVDLHCWPGRRSYTGEPMVELHTLGSPVLLDLLLQELFARGVRPARAGEFTLRAFLAGRIDLAQAEAVLGVIDADTPGELHSALRQLAGGVSREFDRLRSDLLDLLADLEAGLDFADEEIEFITPGQLAARLRAARESLRELAGQARDRQRESARWRVVLAGPPNAGKSTLFNALAGREAALVSPWAGTTRDWLAVEVELAGVPVLLVDTAGQETAVDEVSAQSQARQAEQVARADLVLWCEPATHPGDEPGDGMSDRAASAEPNQDRSASSSQLAPGGAGRSPAQTCPDGALRVATKCDLPGGSSGGVGVAEGAELAVSARRPETLVQLAEWVARRLESDPAGRGWLVGTTAARAADSVRGAAEALERALALAEHEPDQELLAVEVREALAELGKITGAVYTDDILDRIFSKFCIGK